MIWAVVALAALWLLTIWGLTIGATVYVVRKRAESAAEALLEQAAGEVEKIVSKPLVAAALGAEALVEQAGGYDVVQSQITGLLRRFRDGGARDPEAVAQREDQTGADRGGEALKDRGSAEGEALPIRGRTGDGVKGREGSEKDPAAQFWDEIDPSRTAA